MTFLLLNGCVVFMLFNLAKSDAFAEQEIYASLTAFNFASRICHEVVVQQPKEGMYAYKVNFKMAVMLCKEFLRTPNADEESCCGKSRGTPCRFVRRDRMSEI